MSVNEYFNAMLRELFLILLAVFFAEIGVFSVSGGVIAVLTVGIIYIGYIIMSKIKVGK